MIFIIFTVILLLSGYFFRNQKRILSFMKPRVRIASTRGNKYGKAIKRIHFFPISMPILDGLYLLFTIRKHGMDAVDYFAGQLSTDEIYEITLGLFSMVFSRDAKFNAMVLNSSEPGHLSRPSSYFNTFVLDVISKGLLGAPYNKWTHQRKIVARVFTSSCLKSYMQTVDRHSKDMIKEMLELMRSEGGQIEGSSIVKCIENRVFKITLEFIMGSAIDIYEAEEAAQFFKDFWEFKDIFSYRILHIQCYIPLVWSVHPKRKRETIVVNRMREFVTKVITKYEKRSKTEDGEPGNGARERCLIEEMLNYGATHHEIYNEVVTFFVAGLETVIETMSVILNHLACNPELQVRCQNEIDEQVDSESSEVFDTETLSRLEYLERFLSECLRINPTIPLTGRGLDSPLKINEELSLKPGQFVAISPWLIHHNPKYYPSPETFDPDRFLPEKVQKRGPGTFLPFSTGYRNCIGRRLAMMELKTLTARILQSFDVFSGNKQNDVKLLFQLILTPERPFPTILKIRKDLQV